MKILIDARMYGLENTGIGRYIINLLEEVQKQDSKNDYVVLLRKKYYDSLKFSPNFKKVLADFGVYGIAEQIRMPFLLMNEKPDVSHFPHFNVPFFWFGKYVVTIHDLTMHASGRVASNLPIPVYILKRVVYKLLFRRAIGKSTKILVPTNSVKNEIKSNYRTADNKIIVTYEGVNNVFAKTKPKNEAVLNKFKLTKNNYLIYAGNAYPHKNLKRVVDALYYLKSEKDVVLNLVIAGKVNKFTKDIINYAKEKGVDDCVITAGFVSDLDLICLYINSLAFIYPSMSEGFGLQGLEALAAGAKLIASDIPVFREVYGDCAFYFDPMNHYSIANAIEKVKSSKQKEGVKELLSRYCWEKTAEITLQTYRALL